MAVVDGSIIKTVVSWSLQDNTIAQNVFTHEVSDPSTENPSNATVISAMGTWITSLYGNITGILDDDADIVSYVCDEVTWDGTKWEVFQNIGSGTITITLTGVGDPLPAQNAGVLVGYTAKPKVRARKFIPALVEGQTTVNELTAGAITALGDLATDWLTDISIGTAAELIASVADNTGLAWPIAYLVIDSIVGSQRRRKPGVGV